MNKTVLLAYLSACVLAFAQAPSVDKSTVAFTYQYNNANNVLTAKVTAKLTSTTSAMTVDYMSLPPGWLSVTPLSGTSPLALTVTANPTSLAPGTYSGTVNIHNGGNYATQVTVSLTITNPASSLLLSAPATTPLTQTGPTAYSLMLNYTSGGVPPTAEIDVGTTGDIIPFNVTTAVTKAGTGTVANWLRVNTMGSPPATSTSGVAAGSSVVPVLLGLDQTAVDTLDAIVYTGTIAISPVKTGSSSSSSASSITFTVTVSLSVSPGTPVLCVQGAVDPFCNNVAVPIFPSQMPVLPISPAAAPVPPLLTLYGDNFFYNGTWVFYQRPDLSFHPLPTTWVSRRILTAIIPVADLTPPMVAAAGEIWNIIVVNGAPGTNPSNANSISLAATFNVTDPTQPSIQAVVNAASYLATATQLGTGNPTFPSVVSPREIVSIFGLNLGPASICSNSPTQIRDSNGNPLTDANGNLLNEYSTTINNCPNIGVSFTVGANGPVYPAPLIMATSNQINAIVPAEVGVDNTGRAVADGTPVTITVTINGAPNPANYANAVKMSFNPGIFTFGGNGQGQAAVLNVDANTGAITVNGASSAIKGSAIEIFATGLGDLKGGDSLPGGMIDGQVANGAVALAEDSYRVLIGGQSAPVFYAGTAGTGVAGLVQINAVVPPGTASGAQLLTVEIGPLKNGAVTARRSQAAVTINVK